MYSFAKHTCIFLCGSSLVLVLIRVRLNLGFQQLQSLSQVVTCPEKRFWISGSNRISNKRRAGGQDLNSRKWLTDSAVKKKYFLLAWDTGGTCRHTMRGISTTLRQLSYLTIHLQVDPSRSSCSSVYSRMFCSWSSWSQYIRPCRSRPIGCRRIFSGSSSLIAILNLRLSSNWHSQRYCRVDKINIRRGLMAICIYDFKENSFSNVVVALSADVSSKKKKTVILWECLTCTPWTFPGSPSVPAPMPRYCSTPGKPAGNKD